MSDFAKSALFTAIPVSILGAGAISGSIWSTSSLMAAVWVILGIAVVSATAVAMVLRTRGRKESAAGIFAGLAISLIITGGSCFASLVPLM